MRSTFQLENLKERYLSEDKSVDGRIELIGILKETQCEGVDWIHLV
jgi:hypothetical protein